MAYKEINTPFVNSSFLMYLAISFLAIIAAWQTYPDFFFFVFIILLIGLAYSTWFLFTPVNKIIIDSGNKVFIVSSRNPIKLAIEKEKRYQFSEVQKFYLKESEDWRLIDRRYFVMATLKDADEIYFTQTFKEETSKEIVTFLNKLIHK